MALNQNDQEGEAPTPLLKLSFDLTAWTTLLKRNEGNAKRRSACVVVEVCMFAKNTIEVSAQSVLSTTTRSTEQKSSR